MGSPSSDSLCLDVPLFKDRQGDAYIREAVRACAPHIRLTHIMARLFSRSSISGLAKFDRLSSAHSAMPSDAATDRISFRSAAVRSSGEATGRFVSIERPLTPAASPCESARRR
jgi:hypothetical protein